MNINNYIIKFSCNKIIYIVLPSASGSHPAGIQSNTNFCACSSSLSFPSEILIKNSNKIVIPNSLNNYD